MNRRQFVAAATGAAAGLAGCLSDSDGEIRTDEFNGQQVSLAPATMVHEWYQDGDTRFVDARRTQQEYVNLHIEGAVFSPAPDGLPEDDPVEEWPTDERIVTYCVCPHALAGSRASSLVAAGYEEVYALDEGLQEWYERGYPVSGLAAGAALDGYDVRGAVDPSHAGEYVVFEEPETGQLEPVRIADDGSFETTIHFVDVDEDTILTVETPEDTREATIGELTNGALLA